MLPRLAVLPDVCPAAYPKTAHEKNPATGMQDFLSYVRVQTMFLSTANIIWRHSDTFAVFLSTAR